MPRVKKHARKEILSTELTYETKMILVVLLLLLFYPAGVVMMWIWMKWPVWVKLLVMLPILFIFAFVAGISFLFATVIRHHLSFQERVEMMQQEQLKKLQMSVTPSPSYQLPTY